jgi:hypothetical protein
MDEQKESSIFDRDAEIKLGRDYAYAPLEKSGLQKIEERIFSIFRGKKKPVPVKHVKNPDTLPAKHTPILPEFQPPQLPVTRKTTFEKALDQIKFPQITKLDAVVRCLGMVLFAYGAYSLDSNLPGHANLVLGIVIVSVATNLIVASR